MFVAALSWRGDLFIPFLMSCFRIVVAQNFNQIMNSTIGSRQWWFLSPHNDTLDNLVILLGNIALSYVQSAWVYCLAYFLLKGLEILHQFRLEFVIGLEGVWRTIWIWFRIAWIFILTAWIYLCICHLLRLWVFCNLMVDWVNLTFFYVCVIWRRKWSY